jgi:translation initiation factor IF-2
MRPTISISDRGRGGGPSVVERKPVTQAPQLLVPAPAQIKGPRVVREEKPDSVPTPRKRTLPNEPSQPNFVQARPQGGRGVKTSEEEGTEDAEKKKAGGKGRTLSSRRRGPDGRRGEADAKDKLREFSEADLEERRRRISNPGQSRIAFEGHIERVGRRGTHVTAKTAIQKGEPIDIE